MRSGAVDVLWPRAARVRPFGAEGPACTLDRHPGRPGAGWIKRQVPPDPPCHAGLGRSPCPGCRFLSLSQPRLPLGGHRHEQVTMRTARVRAGVVVPAPERRGGRRSRLGAAQSAATRPSGPGLPLRCSQRCGCPLAPRLSGRTRRPPRLSGAGVWVLGSVGGQHGAWVFKGFG